MHHHHRHGPPPFVAWRRGEFGLFGFGPAFGPGGRGRGGPGRRAARGDVRSAILLLLRERPMHGYEIIAELDERTSGIWRPSPGSVYPTLALLEDEGLVASSEDEGKRRFALTDAGRARLAERPDGPPPWEEIAANADPGALSLRESAALLVAACAQVGRAGTPEQVDAAAEILDEARRRLYGLLAAPTST